MSSRWFVTLIAAATVTLTACMKKVTTVEEPLSSSPSPSSSSARPEARTDDKIEKLKQPMERLSLEEPPPPPPASEAYIEDKLNGKMVYLQKELESTEPARKTAPTKKAREADADMAISGLEGYAVGGGGSAASAVTIPTSRFTGAAASAVKAATHDDNEEIISYREFCSGSGKHLSPYTWDISERYIIRVTHDDSSTAFGSDITIADTKGKPVFTARIPAGGEVVLLPKIDLENYQKLGDYTLSVDNEKPLPLKKGQEDQLNYILASPRRLPDKLTLQICFLMDATGSMSDEIEQLQDVIFSIHSRIVALPSKPEVRFSIVAYRDRKDKYLVKGYHFTGSIDSFQLALESIEAGGGGDFPEDIEAGFNWCLDSLAWQKEALKFIFLVADAPPHLEKKVRNYLYSAKKCRKQGIMICPVGASGLDITGEYVFRQIALVTRGQFVFLHYGEQGESNGSATAADPGKVSHHTGTNYNARRLDDIVVDIVSGELSFLTAEKKVVRVFPEPQQQSDLIDIRMKNLLQQVIDVPTPLGGKSIVLSPFSIADPTLAQLSEYLWGTALEKLPGYTDASIIERQRLQEVLKEQAISLSGLTEEKDAMSVGKLLNADYLILSRLHFLGAMRLCHMRLVDCTTGTIVRAARVRL
jgi:hypothetical protein